MSCLRVGLTGGIGSGKTTASDYFATLGVPIIDTDILARELVEPGQPALREIINLFGDEVVNSNGILQRNQLRDLVFSDPEKRRRLENILHPRIRDCAEKRASNVQAAYCIIVIPLLLESRPPFDLDRILVIDLPQDMQRAWIAKRDELDPAQIEAVLASQANREERLAIADDVIVNDGDKQQLYRKLDKLHVTYLELGNSKQPD